ncbi:MAG TPA: DUF2207 domain-containing protein [bacterium]|nr:DUF2207 domain-containing protein [bacterium]
MNKRFNRILFTLILFIFSNSLLKSTVFAEKIDSFNSNIEINKDGTVTIEEKIKYDFENSQKHGLVRNLDFKTKNEDGKTYITQISIVSITDDVGHEYNYSKSKIGDYIELKIGDADKLITGKKTYVIKYNISGALRYFTDHDEFYWNLLGFDWNVPILKFSSSITLPTNTIDSELKYLCYEGYVGSTSQTCSINNTNGKINVTSSKLLNPSENITVAISFPKNIVAVLEPKEDKPSIFLRAFQVLLGLGASVWYVFFPVKYLYDSIKESNNLKRNQRIVSAWFEPPKYDDGVFFSPAETGFIVDNKIDHRELTATIIHLAQRGFLKIKENENKHYSFIRLKDVESSELRNFEKGIMEALFRDGIDISSLDQAQIDKLEIQLSNLKKLNKIIKIPYFTEIQNQLDRVNQGDRIEVTDKELKRSKTLFSKIAKFNKTVEEEVVNREMYNSKPTNDIARNITFIGLGLTTMNLPLVLVSIIFGKKNIKRTEKGIEKYSEAISLFNFLKSQDEQVNFQSKNQMFFEKLLPYAAAFGVEKIWAERFKDITLVKPDWYEGDNYTSSGFVAPLTHSIGGSMKSAYSSGMSSTRSSSGFSSGFSGGSSGGGGGGGGGGSW